MKLGSFKLKRRFPHFLVDGEFFSAKKSKLGSHREVADRNVDGFVNFVDVLHLVFEVEKFRLLLNFGGVNLHDVADRVVFKLLLYNRITMFAFAGFYLEFHMRFFGLVQKLLDCLFDGLCAVLVNTVFDVLQL